MEVLDVYCSVSRLLGRMQLKLRVRIANWIVYTAQDAIVQGRDGVV